MCLKVSLLPLYRYYAVIKPGTHRRYRCFLSLMLLVLACTSIELSAFCRPSCSLRTWAVGNVSIVASGIAPARRGSLTGLISLALYAFHLSFQSVRTFPFVRWSQFSTLHFAHLSVHAFLFVPGVLLGSSLAIRWRLCGALVRSLFRITVHASLICWPTPESSSRAW